MWSVRPNGEYLRGLSPFVPINRKFSTLRRRKSRIQKRKERRKGTNEVTNEPTDGAAGLAERERTYEEGRTKPGINSGRRTYGRTDRRGARVARASERVRKAGDHDETRENRLRQDRSGISYYMQDFYIYIDISY